VDTKAGSAARDARVGRCEIVTRDYGAELQTFIPTMRRCVACVAPALLLLPPALWLFLSSCLYQRETRRPTTQATHNDASLILNDLFQVAIAAR